MSNQSSQHVNRYIILAAAAIAGLLAGTSYMWSVFQKPLIEYHGWEPSQVALAYSFFFIMVFIGVVAGGPLQRRFKPKYLVLVAGLLQGFGFLLTGFATSLFQLYFFYSFLAGLGNGFIYTAAVSAATKWFPDKKGMANGICIGCMGLAPLFFAPLGNMLIENFGVLGSFKINGVIMIVAFLIVSWFIQAPEPGWKPQGWTPPTYEADAGKSSVNVSGMNRTPLQVIKQPVYYVMLVMTFCACCSGVMMTGQASVIAQEVAHIDAAQGALQVGLLAVFSFAGRMIFGSLSDKIGRFNMYLVLLAATAIDMLFFFGQAYDFVTFLVVMGVTGCCFGGVMAMLPSLVGDTFGTANFELDYPLVYFGYTGASMVAPVLASSIFTSTGSYSYAFTVAGLIAALGFLLCICAKILAAKMNARDALSRK